MPTGTRFIDPFGDLRRVVLPALQPDQDQRPNQVLWSLKDQPLRIAGQVYTVREADAKLELLPQEVWAVPVMNAVLSVRVLKTTSDPVPDEPPPEGPQ